MSDCSNIALSIRNKKSLSSMTDELEVYYSFTDDPGLRSSALEKYISPEEKKRAEKFHFSEDRDNYIFSHAWLRVVLSEKLNTAPEKILIEKDDHNKPAVSGSPYNFNITHTRTGFAFALSQYNYVGIDMENINRKSDFSSIINSYFSPGDKCYIEAAEGNVSDRFFLLWTRKEAFLKAIGVGITTDLKQFEVYKGTGEIPDEADAEFDYAIQCYNHFIYTKKISDCYLSIASPNRALINLKQINKETYTRWQ